VAKDEFAEVTIKCDEDAVLVARQRQNVCVAETAPIISDVSYVVPGFTQLLHHAAWQILVDEQLHEGGGTA
jgi:hypothetical protein